MGKASPIRQAKGRNPTTSARSISFVTPLIQAILQDRKTQTRRLIKPQPDEVRCNGPAETIAFQNGRPIPCRFGRAGDLLWVQERWTDRADDPALFDVSGNGIIYAAELNYPLKGRWKPARFMPRRHSRLTLQIDAVRIERLTAISDADARAEGFDTSVGTQTPVDWFRELWDGLSDPQTNWQADPFVWVIDFQRVQRPMPTGDPL